MSYDLKKIIKLFENSTVSKLELEIDNMKIKLEKNTTTEIVNQIVTTPQTQVLNSNVANNIENTENLEGITQIKSPVVGTFYTINPLTQTEYVKVGSKVSKGDVLCVIEAMKVMNEIVAPQDGVITKSLFENDALVQYDDVLFHLGE